ncbi:unnamed protein product [Anisakis simplex]|uniref:Uncharacterized protein n=1 Tax=Anisakis simplex TaxID=6269 RepID=A0A0M3JSF7_ANISI|nr:unnamed protein product [Anisakis simplex]
MSPHQSFRHTTSFPFGLPSPASLISPDTGPNSAYQMQQKPFFFLPSTPKSSQSTASSCANSHRRRYAGNRPRSVVLFPSNTAQPHSPYFPTTPTILTNGHQKMMLSQSAPMVVSNHVPPQQQQSHHPHFHHSSSQQYSKKNMKNCITQQQQYQQQRQRPLSESRGGSPVNCFAGAKFSESPKAQLIPLPPMQWLTDASDSETTTDQNSDSSDSSLSFVMHSKCGSDEFSAVPSIPSSSLSVQCKVTATSSTSTSPQQLCRPGPMRMNPLQLIAAVAAS